jgi:hypothetical protein
MVVNPSVPTQTGGKSAEREPRAAPTQRFGRGGREHPLFWPRRRGVPIAGAPEWSFKNRMDRILRSHGAYRQRFRPSILTRIYSEFRYRSSLGPVPKHMWQHPTVLRYDTGVRDVYRMLVLFRRMLTRIRYNVAWDCMALGPYKDLIKLLQREGYVDEIREPYYLKRKTIQPYSVRR